jgi:hypothetical protein
MKKSNTKRKLELNKQSIRTIPVDSVGPRIVGGGSDALVAMAPTADCGGPKLPPMQGD